MIRGFFHFWYDFIIGDDPIVAIGVVIALALTYVLVHVPAHGSVASWWLLPAATVILLIASLIRAARAARRA